MITYKNHLTTHRQHQKTSPHQGPRHGHTPNKQPNPATRAPQSPTPHRRAARPTQSPQPRPPTIRLDPHNPHRPAHDPSRARRNPADKPKSLHTLEISEAQKKIRLESLEKVADALDCDLVYALVPRDTLHIHYRNRARKIMTARMRSVENTMELENQAMMFSQDYIEKQIDVLITGGFVHWEMLN